MIAYPMPGFISYLELVSNTIGNKASINVGNVNDINNKLLKPQLQNLQATCQRYVESSGAEATGTIQGDCNRLISTRIEGNDSLLQTGGSIFDGMDDLLNDSVSFAGGFALGAENGKNSNSNMAFGGSTSSTGGSGSLSGGNVSGDGDSGLQAAAKARTKLREIRKKQLGKLDNFKKAVGAERAELLLSAQKAMTSKFNNPAGGKLASLGGGFGIAAGSLGKGSGNGKSALADGERGDEGGQKSDYGANTNFNNSQPNYDLGYNSGSGSGSGSGNVNRESVEAQNRIQEAIEHRDESPEEWKNKSGDTLWKIITRTYIRNYDRLLKKRKKRINSDF